jgi:hypothetical protein
MLDQAGRNWSFANDPSYNGGHTRYGYTAQGVPYSYQAVNGGPQINKWAQTGGATPTGVTTYNQFAMPQSVMSQINGLTNGQAPAQQTTTPTQQQTTSNPYGAGYTGYGNTHISTGATPTTIASTNGISNPSIPNGGMTPAATGPASAAAPVVTNPATQTSAVPRARIANPAVGMPATGATPGLPNNTTPNVNTMPITPKARVSGNYNTALNQNLYQNRS